MALDTLKTATAWPLIREVNMIKTIQLEVTVKLESTGPFVGPEGLEQDPDAAWLDRRNAERAPIECPVRFASEALQDLVAEVDGRLCDLSKTGCRIFSLQPPARGSQITVVLRLPDGLPAMRLIGTTVRHVRGHEFGAEFLPLTAEERRRVQTLIFKHVTWSPYSLRRPAFRLAEE